jgi:hypothetical protein
MPHNHYNPSPQALDGFKFATLAAVIANLPK